MVLEAVEDKAAATTVRLGPVRAALEEARAHLLEETGLEVPGGFNGMVREACDLYARLLPIKSGRLARKPERLARVVRHLEEVVLPARGEDAGAKVYTLPELREGTGFERGARFVSLAEYERVCEQLAGFGEAVA